MSAIAVVDNFMLGQKPVADEEAAAAQAYEAGAVARERPAAIAQACLGLGLAVAWTIADHFAEPVMASSFLILRLYSGAALIVLIVAMLRTGDITNLRMYRLLAFISEGAAIMPTLPHVDNYAAYVVGFSLAMWSSALLPVWPARWAAVAYMSLIVMHVATFPAYDVSRHTAFIGASFYLFSAAIIVSALLYIRVRLARRAFTLAHQLEQRRRQFEETLAALRGAQDRLTATEKMSMLGRLLSGLSAEMEGPVRRIGDDIEKIRKEVEQLCVDLARLGKSTGRRGLDELWQSLDLDFVLQDAPKAVKTMGQGAQRMAQVHTDLSTFMRGEAPQFVRADLNESVTATVEMFRRGAPKTVTINTDYAKLPAVSHQPGQLSQVLLNLLQNALDAVGETGIISVRSRAVEGAVEIAVLDEGPGVAAAHVERLFEPFFTTKAVGKGTGLGLATAHEIVRNHGGTLRYEPGPNGKGACFVMRLPVPTSL